MFGMRATTITTGIICILLGVGLSIGAHRHGSNWATAAIPAYVGLLWLIGGLVSTTVKARMIVSHVLVVLALLLVGMGLGMGLPKLIKYHNGTLPPDAAVRPLAWWGQCTLGIIMLAFLVLAIQSFIKARRWRKQNELPAA